MLLEEQLEEQIVSFRIDRHQETGSQNWKWQSSVASPSDNIYLSGVKTKS